MIMVNNSMYAHAQTQIYYTFIYVFILDGSYGTENRKLSSNYIYYFIQLLVVGCRFVGAKQKSWN